MAGALYLDTSAALRAELETGVSPSVEARIRASSELLTSRLSMVEASRAFHRLRLRGQTSESKLADAERELNALWARCELWELTAEVCEMARQVARGTPLRALDALHLATYVLARQKIAGLELVTVDARLANAVHAI